MVRLACIAREGYISCMSATGHTAELSIVESTPNCEISPSEVAIIIPTYNGALFWSDLNRALEKQAIPKRQVLIVDSSSKDGTRFLAEASGYKTKSIPSATFRHGATRQLAASWVPWAKYLVYLTQDSIPGDEHSIRNLLDAFTDPTVGAAYGRQVPRDSAGPIERHARLFNYPPESDTRTYESRKKLGIRAAFFSNSFAAYRRAALEEVGGFPDRTIVSEDVQVAALMLRAGWKTKYQASAITIHSHQLSILQEFSRYFDIGVHHSRERWLMNEFGKRQGEGLAFVRSEFAFLVGTKKSLIPLAVVRNLNKYLSYYLGQNEKYLPVHLKKILSGQRAFWGDSDTAQSSQAPRREASRNRHFRALQ